MTLIEGRPTPLHGVVEVLEVPLDGPERVPQLCGRPLLLLDGADVAALVHRPPPLVQLPRVVQGLQDLAGKRDE